MKKVVAVFIIPCLIFITFGLSSCSSCQSRNERKMKQQEEYDKEYIPKKIEENVYPLPTSAEIIELLTEYSAGYEYGITNPPENVGRYFTSARRAINLGVYGADLSYATLYNQDQRVRSYLTVIQRIATDLNMSRIYDQTLYDSVKINYDYRERLVEILTNAFEQTYAYLSDNEQQNLALLVVGGAWVEGMYITTHVSFGTYNAYEVAKVFLEQKKNFETYLEITKPYMNDPFISEFVNNLSPIKTVYEGIGTSLTDDDINRITEAMNIIRAKLVD